MRYEPARPERHPAFIAGFLADRAGGYQHDNPHHPVSDHDAHAAWRDGFLYGADWMSDDVLRDLGADDLLRAEELAA